MMVTGVLSLDGPIDMKRLRVVLDRRLAPFARFHQRVVRPRTRANLPHWEDDESFDVDNHLSRLALPAPAVADPERIVVCIRLEFEAMRKAARQAAQAPMRSRQATRSRA